MGADCKEIASFKTSLSYHEVKARMRMFFLRGNDVDLEYLREAGILNKVIQVQSEVQAINILGYALKKPLADFNQVPAQQLERLLRTGNVCIVQDEARKHLEKVVKQMISWCFELIPLTAVINLDDPKKKRNLETLLIKVHQPSCWLLIPNAPKRCRCSSFSYVDISGRIYSSFENFLKDNKLPPSILCYPEGGVVRFDENDEIVADCCKVGEANAVKGVVDMFVGVVGAAGAVGTIFATGGLAVPFVLVSCGSALYTTGRSIEKLVDASAHGKSVNPFEDAEARNNWLLMSANLLTFASLGISGLATKLEGLTATQISRFMMANRIIRGVSAGVNAVTAIDSICYMINNWQQMTIYERITVACAICFCFREVISFANAERIMRQCQIEGMYRFFKGCTDSFVGGASTVGQGFLFSIKSMFDGNDEYVATGMRLIQTIVRDSFDVTVSDDFVTIRLFGFQFQMRNIISMTGTELDKFLYMIQGIAKMFRDGFALLRTFCSDGPIMRATFKRAEEAGGDRAHYGKAINELIELFMLVRRICDDFSILSDAQLSIGGGHRFTVGSAYNTFVKRNGVSLLRALVEMNPGEVDRMNSLRVHCGKDADIFDFIVHSSTDSSKMLPKIRFLLAVYEICTEKSLRITDVGPTEQIVEVESLVRVGPELFQQSTVPEYLIDPKLFRICQPALSNHREFLATLWNNTCTGPKASDRAFEKLQVLEMAFQSYSPTTIENVISYASGMECPDFARFTYHVLFALKSMENLTREMGLDETAANEVLFSDPAVLRSRFLELTMKAEELSLGGYCSLDWDSVAAEGAQLIEIIKGLASKAQLRFGAVENGALHLDMYPMLRFAAEMGKFNRYIVVKKFNHEEVQPSYDGKQMVYLANEQLRIVIGVVRGLGAYIDTYLFT